MQRAAVAERRSIYTSRPAFATLNYGFYILLAVAIGAFLYYLYSYRDFLLLDLPVMLQGAGLTIILSLISMVLATIFGFIGALGRLSRFASIRWLAFVYVEIIRGSPILVQLLLWGFGVSTALSSIGFDPYNIAYNIATALQSNSLLPDPQPFDAAFYGIIGLSFNYGSALASSRLIKDRARRR
jgi:His/Glu/Gln/Arg/opine family amino acid ABC transporter permease subunit